MSNINVVKRDGSIEDFDIDKVSSSIMGAAMDVGGENMELADELANLVLDIIESNDIEEIEASDIQNIVEKTLIEEGHAATAKEYILKGADRNRMREMDTALMKSFEEITFKSEAESEIKRENANIDSSTAMGTMLKYGSEGAKNFNLLYMMSKDVAEAHKNGDIHIHDLDFYTLTETCCQIPLDKLFKDGFNTGHGFLREPGSIRTAGALAAIAIQSNQNDQHGGQSIPMFDYYLAPYVALSYVKNIAELAKIKFDLTNEQSKELKKLTVDYWEKAENHRVINQSGFNKLSIILTDYLDSIDIEYTEKQIKRLLENVYDKTHDDTFQSMEAFIHNLNTMHSRAGRRTNMVEVPVTWETLCPAV
jgi:ribonucleoside-triphosphate reductase